MLNPVNQEDGVGVRGRADRNAAGLLSARRLGIPSSGRRLQNGKNKFTDSVDGVDMDFFNG
jgi:hypothetical protein